MNLQWKVQNPASECTDWFLPHHKQWWHLSHSVYATAAFHCMNLAQHQLSLPLGNKKVKVTSGKQGGYALVQYCVSLKTVVQPRTSGHMPCHGEFSNHQIPTFLVKILDKSDLMEHSWHKKYHLNQGKNWLYFGFAVHFTHFSDSRRKRMAAYSFMVTAVVQNFVTCCAIF